MVNVIQDAKSTSNDRCASSSSSESDVYYSATGADEVDPDARGDHFPTTPRTMDVHPYRTATPTRGMCIIFNHKIFETLPERKGTEKDENSLRCLFNSFGFQVRVFNDLTWRELDRRLEYFGQLNYDDFDLIIICVLSHGEPGTIWAKDRAYLVEDLWSEFSDDRCPSLAGKPKLFFVNACQGAKFDQGCSPGIQSLPMGDTRRQDDSFSGYFFRIQTNADILVAYSTIPGYYSWRNESEGSWFVRALVSVMKQKAHCEDLLTILAYVNLFVAEVFVSCNNKAELCGMKQAPMISSTLTRKLYFSLPEAAPGLSNNDSL